MGVGIGGVLIGNVGDDLLVGNSGGDLLDGGVGNDRLLGGADNDHLDGGAGNDLLNGGLGFDMADYFDETGAITVGLAITRAQNIGAAGLDTLISIDGVAGTTHLIASDFIV